MSYIALARKWRPRQFTELVGQNHVTQALSNALDQQRLHHAYLFTGTRGVGKTSIARLFAKSLNCEKGVSAHPCLHCDSCLAVEHGHFIDLIEIDGASRTRVEDTREILDNVQYLPNIGRFKIYLIDEVHMLSSHSFNALLKTLEEPPSHVKFLLATTDPQKLPMTILSRCLQFNLKNLTPEVISAHLTSILHQEQRSFETDALHILAKAANGSMRDAISLLDQALISSTEVLDVTAVKQMLGFTRIDYALQIIQALAQKNPNLMISSSHQIASEGGQYHYVLQEMAYYFHKLSLIQALNNRDTLSNTDALLELTSVFSPEDLQLFYQITCKGMEELSYAPSASIGFEMTLLRLYTFRPAEDIPPPTLTYESGASNISSANSALTSTTDSKPAPLHPEHSLVAQSRAITPTESSPRETAPQHVPKEIPMNSNQDWPKLILKLQLQGLALTAAENSVWGGMQDQTVTLKVAKGYHSLFTTTVINRIEQGLSAAFGKKIKIELIDHIDPDQTPAQLRQQAETAINQHAAQSLQNDPIFQKLQQDFAAELVKNSIAPVKDGL